MTRRFVPAGKIPGHPTKPDPLAYSEYLKRILLSEELRATAVAPIIANHFAEHCSDIDTNR